MQLAGDSTLLEANLEESAELSPLRILVVDDWPEVGEMVRVVLMRVEHAVDVVASPRQALARLEDTDYDVVISELFLCDDISGLQLARLIGRRWPNTAFILATGSEASICGLSRIDAMLTKPFGARVLRETVVRVAGSRVHSESAEG
jgi:DNA-binding response OmpR family regulator